MSTNNPVRTTTSLDTWHTFHWLKFDVIAPMASPNKVQYISQKHYDTPTRSRIISETQMLKDCKVYSPNGTKRTQKKLFQELNVPNTSARRISKIQRPCRRSNEPETAVVVINWVNLIFVVRKTSFFKKAVMPVFWTGILLLLKLISLALDVLFVVILRH
jgi:hypothetical protein